MGFVARARRERSEHVRRAFERRALLIALLARGAAPVIVGCTKPTTRERCDLLLGGIAEAR